MNDLHPFAKQGFSQGAATYASGRPDYPAALNTWLTASLFLGPGREALDLGAGTGKFLPQLIATGAGVTAVEPVDAMRAQLVAAFPAVRALVGTAESIPLPAASLDVVVCAQSFHWFASAAALSEIRRVLKPGGALALIWNVRDERFDWVAELTRLLDPYEGDAPRYTSGAWRRCFPARGFGPLRETRFRHQHEGPAERVIVDRTRSVSFVASLPEAERAKLTSALRALIARTPELAGRERVAFPYVTHAYWCEALGDP